MAWTGSVFQMWALATGKAQQPMVVSRTLSTMRSSKVDVIESAARRHVCDTDELPQILCYVTGQSTYRAMTGNVAQYEKLYNI